MPNKPFKAGVLRMEGTNNEEEAYLSLKRSGFDPDYIHISEIGKKKLNDYDLLFIPGGFSAGDYIRAGAIFASRLKSSMKDINKFIDSGKIIIGVCNGFQVLSELGLLPDLDGTNRRSMALAVNDSNRFECRYTYVRYSSKNPIFKKYFDGKILQVPVAHMEGRVIFDSSRTEDTVLGNGQILFQYTNKSGEDSSYPWNPNGSVMDIAGLTNKSGNVIGLMPHPERVYYGYQMMHDGDLHSNGTGELFFKSLYEYTKNLLA
ncbi:MAG: phosphoribosylformylglycinamidine synthase subunit PurQ [Ferroplasma sp.]